MSETLKACPFCGGEPEIEQHGTARVSAIVACTNCGCRLASNENGAGYHWNRRAPSEAQEGDGWDWDGHSHWRPLPPAPGETLKAPDEVWVLLAGGYAHDVAETEEDARKMLAAWEEGPNGAVGFATQRYVRAPSSSPVPREGQENP